jgi:hypothetical protein
MPSKLPTCRFEYCIGVRERKINALEDQIQRAIDWSNIRENPTKRELKYIRTLIRKQRTLIDEVAALKDAALKSGRSVRE